MSSLNSPWWRKYIFQILFLLVLVALIVVVAYPKQRSGPLPVLGVPKISATGDSIAPTVPDFAFVDQDSQRVTNATFDGRVYVANFFFIHCPTICPLVQAETKRVYDHFADDPRVLFLSHSIDTHNDTVAALNAYARRLGIRTDKWHLVTGDVDDIYQISLDYITTAKPNAETPADQFDHSGALVLVDAQRHVRAYCNGPDLAHPDVFRKGVSKFIEDIEYLLDTEYSKN